jgi:hypothetical protein
VTWDCAAGRCCDECGGVCLWHTVTTPPWTAMRWLRKRWGWLWHCAGREHRWFLGFMIRDGVEHGAFCGHCDAWKPRATR